VQVVMPKASGTTPQVVVIPTPVPLPMNGAWAAVDHAAGPTPIQAQTPSTTSQPNVIKEALTTPPTAATAQAPTATTPTTATAQAPITPPPATAQAQPPPPPPPEPVKPTPVSTDVRPDADDADGAGKLLPPPRNVNGPTTSK
jgi:hypothetical protein